MSRDDRRWAEARIASRRRRVELRKRIASRFPLTLRQLGKLRHNHTGCGCRMCKPWKHERRADRIDPQ